MDPSAHRLIISLTTFPGRIGTVHRTIERLLQQSLKPYCVMLWLAREQFPEGEAGLPAELLEQTTRGLQIRWCHDIRSYKKLIPTLREFPDALVMPVDDDILYPRDLLERLYRAHLENPNLLHCHRAHRITFERDGSLTPYGDWVREVKSRWVAPSFNNFCSSGGGTLYHLGVLHPDVMDETLFWTLSPRSDEVWFWAMAVANGVKINVIPDGHRRVNVMRGTQGETMFLQNIYGGQKDGFIKNVLERYPVIMEHLDKSEFTAATPFYRKIFSLRSKGMEKVLCICGMEYRFKNKRRIRRFRQAQEARERDGGKGGA